MKDIFGREIDYMRISVTDRCNYRCMYCMPEEGVADIGHDQVLTFEEIAEIVRAAVGLGFTKFRLTGGEPLVRKDIVELVKMLKAIEGVKIVSMTTNGALLAEYAEALAKAGLDGINISMDSLRYTRHKEITRGGDLDEVIKGINAAVNAGLKPVKINTVVMRGFNDDEIVDFIQLTYQHKYDIRFIELMPVGCEKLKGAYSFMPAAEVMEKLPALRELPAAEGAQRPAARMYKYPGAIGRIGFISPVSDKFCSGCNKIRLTADGKLKTCLHSNTELDIRAALGDPEALQGCIRRAVLAKEEQHQIGIAEPVERDMNRIGG